MRKLLLPIFVLILLAACGGNDRPPTLFEKWNASVLDTERAFTLLRAGNPDAAHRAFAEARTLVLEVLRARESGAGANEPDLHRVPDRLDLMIRIAELSRWLGRNDPLEFRRAARIASRMVEQGSGRASAWGVLGTIFMDAGFWERAVDCLERHLELDRPQERTRVYDDLIFSYLRLAEQELASGGLRSPAAARRHLTRVHELALGGEPRPETSVALERLNLEYAGEANAAADRRDDLELARVHSRYGFLDLCKEKLDEVVKKRGVVSEIRWVVARYWYEPVGTRETLEKADQVYARILKEGAQEDRILAGRIRVRRRLGGGEAAIEEFGAREKPGPEVRTELVLTYLDRAARRDKGDFEGWREDLLRIEELLAGEASEARQAELLLETGFQSVRFEDRDHLERLVTRFRARWPDDRRIVLLEAGVDGLRGEPVLPDEVNESGDVPGETR